MIDIQIPSSEEYDTATASLLATAIKDLHNFNDISEWDRKAKAEIEVMSTILRMLESKQQRVILDLSQEKQEHEAKSFLPKLFDGRKEQKRLLVEQIRLAKEQEQIENLIDQFENAIDFTPDSLEDLKELIKECKTRKKELLIDKKSINAQMASIRVDARQQTSNTISGKYGTWDRRKIRLNKESSLRPHESEKAAIERQIIKLDQIIIWLERLK